nr:Pycsar system effector family protein [Pedobacter sp. ASV19]
MNYLDIIEQIKTHVEEVFHNGKDDRLFYHNLSHTEQVVKHIVKIAGHYQLSDTDFFIVVAAGWFHDIGYFTDCKHHEEAGIEKAREFMGKFQLDEEILTAVAGCIMATRMPQKPEGLLQQIICDADLYHLGTDSFKEKDKAMHKEAEAFYGHDIEKELWRRQTIKFLEAHHYHTTYCIEHLAKGKEENLAGLKDKSLKYQQKMNTAVLDQTAIVKGEESSGKKDKKKKTDRPDKGIETMFRITAGNHQRLSDMADNKAHIMISTNSIILSVILSILLRKLEDNPHLIVPTLILLVICVTTMVFSILATRPTIPSGKFTEQDVRSHKVNLLFFGNFYGMSLTDYERGMQEMMEDRDFLYGSLIRDLHGQGVVLGRKYRLLRIAYNVFMFGIVASVLAFIIAMVFVAM